MFNFLFNVNQFTVEFLLYLSLSVFILGGCGIFFYGYKIILFLMCIELMWLGVGLLCIYSNLIYQNPFGLIFTIVILSVAASESAIGLALLVNFYRSLKVVELNNLSNLRS